MKLHNYWTVIVIVLVHSQGVLQASGLDSGIGAGTAILGYLGPSREDPLRPFSSAPRHLASDALSLSSFSQEKKHCGRLWSMIETLKWTREITKYAIQ